MTDEIKALREEIALLRERVAVLEARPTFPNPQVQWVPQKGSDQYQPVWMVPTPSTAPPAPYVLPTITCVSSQAGDLPIFT